MNMYELLSGAIMMACFSAGIFFFKFWRKTHDKLFMLFGAAFFILSFERMLLGYLGNQLEPSPKIYLIRLSAFIVILIAIYMKNKEKSRSE